MISKLSRCKDFRLKWHAVGADSEIHAATDFLLFSRQWYLKAAIGDALSMRTAPAAYRS